MASAEENINKIASSARKIALRSRLFRLAVVLVAIAWLYYVSNSGWIIYHADPRFFRPTLGLTDIFFFLLPLPYIAIVFFMGWALVPALAWVLLVGPTCLKINVNRVRNPADSDYSSRTVPVPVSPPRTLVLA
ncbi:MAG: hypothetical protein KGI81_00310 [Betaproteobacteria bacterium]|nr:hypothetical protein [Betaproteobacteria bacterium]